MKLLLVVAGLALLAWLSQQWDERQRAKDKAVTDAAFAETEATCRAQHAKQAAYVEGYVPDARSAGKPATPQAERRNRTTITKRAA